MNIKGKIRIDSRAFISKENEDTEQTAAADRARASLVIVGECMMELVIFSEARRCRRAFQRSLCSNVVVLNKRFCLVY